MTIQDYYVDGKKIDITNYDFDFYDNPDIEVYDEEYRDELVYITDKHGKKLGVGWLEENK